MVSLLFPKGRVRRALLFVCLVMCVAPAHAQECTSGSTSDTITLDGPEGWYQLGVPSMTATFQDFLSPIWTQGAAGADSPNGEANVYRYDETAPGSLNNPDAYGMPSLTETMRPGRGYFVYVYEDDDATTPGVQGGFPKMLQTVGDEADDRFRFSELTYTAVSSPADDGWNMAANPFYDRIDWDRIRRKRVAETVYVWDPTTGQYLTWNGIAGSLTNGCIRAYQGFWVQAIGRNPLMGIREARGPGNAPPNQPRTAPVVGLRVEGMPAGADRILSATAHATWLAEASEGLDPYDGYELASLAPAHLALFHTDETGRAFDIRALALDEVPVDLAFDVAAMVGYTPVGGELTLTWPELRHVPAAWSLHILDTKTGALVDLRTADAYTFMLHADAASPHVHTTARRDLHRLQASGSARFRLLVDPSGGQQATASVPMIQAEASAVRIDRPYPNPFTTTTTISYALAEAGSVRIAVYDLLGREVAVLVDREQAVGTYAARLDGSRLAPGVYLVRFDASGTSTSHRVSLVR